VRQCLPSGKIRVFTGQRRPNCNSEHMPAPLPPSVMYLSGKLTLDTQQALLRDLVQIIEVAPFFSPTMPRTGKPFSVRMTNCGPLGWVSDRGGYRYQPHHPVTGRPWPAIPSILLDLWHRLSGYPAPPEACLVNYYDTTAKMGSHQDRDEEDFEAPVLSVSLGDTAVFHVGGVTRSGPKARIRLASGDVLLLAGESRLAFHGIDRILGGSSTLLAPPVFPAGGRLNLTLRRVTKPK